MPSIPQAPAIVIRDIEDISEMRELGALEKEVWRFDDRDLVPLAILAASKEVGATLIGAFDGEPLVGFVYGFVGLESPAQDVYSNAPVESATQARDTPGHDCGHLVIHSHMLAVRSEYRSSNLGYRLKLAQREHALARGIKRITWTFDPLQSLNAHFNFAKLGVVADTYKINFYGEATSSILHQIGTDRLWVTWLLDSPRVTERLQREAKGTDRPCEPEQIVPLVQCGKDGAPYRNELDEALRQRHALVQIPSDINALQSENPRLGMTWRQDTRWAFTEAIASGYFVEEFYRTSWISDQVGVYLLSSDRRSENPIQSQEPHV